MDSFIRIALLTLIFYLFFSCNEKQKIEPIKDTIHVADNNDDFESYNYLDLLNTDFIVDDLHSYIGFKIKYFGYSPVRGRFNKFHGTVFHDPKNLGVFSTSIILDISSINTGNERRDTDLKKEGGWFDQPNFPNAKFISTGVNLNQNGFELIGDLTIKGITKSVKIECQKPLDLSKDAFMNDQFSISGKFTISRNEFGIVGGDFWTTTLENGLMQLSDEVELEMEFHCRRTDYEARYSELDSHNVRKVIIDEINNSSVQKGLGLIDSLYSINEMTSGAMSTIGYILLDQGLESAALEIFNKKMQLFGNSSVLQNQLGVTFMTMNNKVKAKEAFIHGNKLDTLNSRGFEYIKFLEKLDLNSKSR